MRSSVKLALIAGAFVCSLAILATGLFSPTRVLGLMKPAAPLYDETANARLVVADGRKKAETSGKLLLVEYGANWCAYCRQLGSLMRSPAVQKVVSQHYVVVTVDVGRFDKNLDLYPGGAGALQAIPAVAITDPMTGNLLNEDDLIIPDGDVRERSASAVASWLAKYGVPKA